MANNVTLIKGDIFQSQAQTLVNTVNCVGIMGKGLALGFKTRYPDMFKDYAERCKRGRVQLGRPYLYRSLVPPWILNFPTKDHWRSVSRLSDIVEGLNYLKQHYQDWGITSLAIPALGCANGQLEWKVVGPTMYRILSTFEIPIEFYVPLNESVDDFQKLLSGKSASPSSNGAVPRIKPAWIALVAVLAELEQEPYRNPVGRTMFQKIAYFATMSGLPTDLEYRRGSYGPFAGEFKRMITQLVNNGLIVEHSRGKMFEVRVGSAFRDAARQYSSKIEIWRPIIRRVTDLFTRVNTQQAEIMATAHKAAYDLGKQLQHKPTAEAVKQEVMNWKQKRRPPLDQKSVEDAINVLAVLGWIKVVAGKEWVINESELI